MRFHEALQRMRQSLSRHQMMMPVTTSTSATAVATPTIAPPIFCARSDVCSTCKRRGSDRLNASCSRVPRMRPVYGSTKICVAPACAWNDLSALRAGEMSVRSLGAAARARAASVSSDSDRAPGVTRQSCGLRARSMAPSNTSALPVSARTRMKSDVASASQRCNTISVLCMANADATTEKQQQTALNDASAPRTAP